MGSCESKGNIPELTNRKESLEDDKINCPIKITETKNKNGRIKECILENSSPFEKLDSSLSNVLKSICKIKIRTINEIITGSGFLLKFNINQELFYCLISNEHVIRNDLIRNNNIIHISYDSEFQHANVKLESNKRYIKSFTDNDLDITVVQLLDEDKIPKEFFLVPESENIINNKLNNNRIYIPQYADGKELKNARGILKNIDNYEFSHSVNTKEGSSGSPIFLENCNKVIGIHTGASENKSENYGNFIYPVINFIRNELKDKYIIEKYIWENGAYYKGQVKNNLPNGKGKKYNPNGKIEYEGDFINGKFEGNGKYIFDDGEYYEGQWKNGLRSGKGIHYYSNGNIKYEGHYYNDKYEGNGKYINEDGESYEGQWKNGFINGKGIYYYSNGNIMYEGDFINCKREGYGKYNFKNGEYYIGEWKNDLRNGKGIEYYSNGKIKHNGYFINGKFEGNGKSILKNDESYEWQRKNGSRNGIEYDLIRNIKKKNNRIDDEFVGN